MTFMNSLTVNHGKDKKSRSGVALLALSAPLEALF